MRRLGITREPSATKNRDRNVRRKRLRAARHHSQSTLNPNAVEYSPSSTTNNCIFASWSVPGPCSPPSTVTNSPNASRSSQNLQLTPQPSIATSEPQPQPQIRNPVAQKTHTGEEPHQQFKYVPSILLTNTRSICNKIETVGQKLTDAKPQIACFTETWITDESAPVYKSQLTTNHHMVSSERPKNPDGNTGGETMILVDRDYVSSSTASSHQNTYRVLTSPTQRKLYLNSQ